MNFGQPFAKSIEQSFDALWWEQIPGVSLWTALAIGILAGLIIAAIVFVVASMHGYYFNLVTLMVMYVSLVGISISLCEIIVSPIVQRARGKDPILVELKTQYDQKTAEAIWILQQARARTEGVPALILEEPKKEDE